MWVRRVSRSGAAVALCAGMALSAGSSGSGATVGVPTVPKVVSTTEWPQYQANSAHTGAVADPALTRGALARLTPSWRVDDVDGQMVVSGGVLYVEGSSGEITAIRVSDGSVLWRTTLPIVYGAQTPAVADGVLVVAAAYLPRPRRLGGSAWGLDVATGRVLWQTTFPSQVYAAPTIVGHSVVVTWVDGTSRLHLRTGAVMWKSTLAASGSPAVAGQTVVVGNGQTGDRSDVHALDLATGATTWVRPITPIYSEQVNPVIGTGTAYTNTCPGTAAMSLTTGSPRWTIPNDSCDQPTLVGGTLVSRDGVGLSGTNRYSGASRWHVAPAEGAEVSAFPVAVGDTVITAVGPAWLSPRRVVRLEMRDVSTGSLVGSLDLGAQSDVVGISSVVAAEGHVFVEVRKAPFGGAVLELSPS